MSEVSTLTRIGEVACRCPVCGWEGQLDDTEPDCDGDGSLGCPVEDCGTVIETWDYQNERWSGDGNV